MSALAVQAMKAIMRNLGPLSEEDGALADGPADLRQHIFDVEAELVEKLQEQADEAGEYLWTRSWSSGSPNAGSPDWNGLMTDEEALEVSLDLVTESFPNMVAEVVAHLDMVATRQPGLADEIAARRVALAGETEEESFANILADAS